MLRLWQQWSALIPARRSDVIAVNRRRGPQGAMPPGVQPLLAFLKPAHVSQGLPGDGPAAAMAVLQSMLGSWGLVSDRQGDRGAGLLHHLLPFCSCRETAFATVLARNLYNRWRSAGPALQAELRAVMVVTCLLSA